MSLGDKWDERRGRVPSVSPGMHVNRGKKRSVVVIFRYSSDVGRLGGENNFDGFLSDFYPYVSILF